MVLFKIYGDIYDTDIKKESDIYDADMVLFRFDDVNSLSDILLSNINDAAYNLR